MALSRKLFQRSSFGTRSMSWWRSVQPAPKDPILGVTEAFLADPTPHKVNVGVVSLSFFSFCVYLGHLCQFTNRALNLPSFLLSDFLLSIPICSTTYTFPFKIFHSQFAGMKQGLYNQYNSKLNFYDLLL